MSAYNFKRQFIEPIRTGTKRQTIRSERKGRSRHAQPGEVMQLYFGMRTKHCQLIARVKCVAVVPATITLSNWHVDIDNVRLPFRKLNIFARSDGFTDWAEMRAFWRKTHPGLDVFHGVLLRWEPICD